MYAEEAYNTGEGDFRGIDAAGAMRLFNVYTDNEWDEPTTVFETENVYTKSGRDLSNLALNRTNVRPYTPHPNTRFSALQVSRYERGVRLAPYLWQSMVVYEPEGEIGRDRWHIDYEAVEETESIAFDVPRDAQDAPKAFGSPAYKATDSTTAEYSTSTATGSQQRLERTGAFKRERFERYGVAVRFSCWRIFPFWSWTLSRMVTAYGKTVNSVPFLGYPIGAVRFVGMTSREVPAVSPLSTRNVFPQYEIRLFFAINENLWSPVMFYDRWIDDDRNESLILRNGQPVGRQRDPYFFQDFSGMFNSIAQATAQFASPIPLFTPTEIIKNVQPSFTKSLIWDGEQSKVVFGEIR